MANTGFIPVGWAWISTLRFVDLSGNANIGSEGVDLLADELPFWQQAQRQQLRMSMNWQRLNTEKKSAQKFGCWESSEKNREPKRGLFIQIQLGQILVQLSTPLGTISPLFGKHQLWRKEYQTFSTSLAQESSTSSSVEDWVFRRIVTGSTAAFCCEVLVWVSYGSLVISLP